MLCLEAVALHLYCNMVEWSVGHNGIEAYLSSQLAFFAVLTVGFVIRPVKTVPEMTYHVSNGTLSLFSLTWKDLSLK